MRVQPTALETGPGGDLITDSNYIQRTDVVQFAIAYAIGDWYVAAQIQVRMRFDGCFGLT